jgi:protein tyrosine/serine phosphatase
VLIHCKSGADRAGLASAIWLMVMEGRPVEEARAMLSWRYLHLRWSRTGVLDLVLDSYGARNAAAPIGFEDWVATEYDAEAVQAAFDGK